MSYEPSKRMFIKNLPPDVTKAEIVEMIRKRSRAQPSNIEIGKSKDGEPRQYAHVTVEGLKSVIESIQGVPIRGYNVACEPAKAHYSIAIRDANRQKEREAEAEAEAAEAEREAELAELAANPPKLMCKSKVKSFYHYRRRYGEVASEIAKEFRESYIQHGFKTDAERAEEEAAANAVVPPNVVTDQPHATRGRRGGKNQGENRDKKFGDKKPKAVEAPAPPPPPPPPSKEERKVAGLQAKLLALRAKMGK